MLSLAAVNFDEYVMNNDNFTCKKHTYKFLFVNLTRKSDSKAQKTRKGKVLPLMHDCSYAFELKFHPFPLRKEVHNSSSINPHSRHCLRYYINLTNKCQWLKLIFLQTLMLTKRKDKMLKGLF